MTGSRKRSIERDYRFYDPPEVIRAKIEQPREKPYRRSADRLEVRDQALMALEYICAARVVEITGGPVRVGILPGIQASQFYKTEDFLFVRNLKNVKHKFIKIGVEWVQIAHWHHYPTREEIPIPRHGGLAWISEAIEAQLDLIPRGPLFQISPVRAYQVINERNGEFNHYFKDMGLKLWYRLFNRDAFRLKKFSGHKKWESLEKYMGDIDEAKENMLSWEVK